MIRHLLLAVWLAMPAPAAISIISRGYPDRVTVAVTWSTVSFPSGTEYIRIRPETITGYYTRGCTDGAALGADYATVTADTTEWVQVTDPKGINFCIAGSGAGTVQLTPSARGL
jgi:hypothetical protein